eukprot:TRINITY_DN16036_c0_g1_i7.p2 TRINITY_DN16036_c0_g1~~TRINITY_DN16036_c0_g1_i7.p2  ORF type:complete len:170 (-),score=22.81 TRINITY_DN16036_c0_g1_i7:14-523(-)
MVSILLTALLIAPVLTSFNSNCKLFLPDNSLYDLSGFRASAPKDYLYSDDERLYVVNFCGPAIKVCSGIENAFASMWNTTSFQCIQTLADGDPVARYIDSKVPSRGIIIEYVGETTTTQIEIECDRRFERPKLVRVGLIAYRPNVYLSLIHICRCRRYAVCRSRWSPYH